MAAAEIRHVARVGALELALNVGEIVFHRIFEGDLELLRRNGPKHVSFGLLAARADLGMSRANLWRAVAIYELSLRQPQLRHGSHLGVSHVRAVLGLPELEQERLLARAESERLDVHSLQAAAGAVRRGTGGRPPKTEVVRAIDALMRVAGLPLRAFQDQLAISKLDDDGVDCTLAMLEELERRLAALRGTLRSRRARRRTRRPRPRAGKEL